MIDLNNQQKIDYWKRLLPIGSVWLTQQLSCRFVTVKDIYYDIITGYIVVHYTRDDAPDAIFQKMAGAFFNYIVSYQVM